MKKMIVRIWKKWFRKEAGQVENNGVAGIPEKDVSRLLHSQKIVFFHPFLYYMAHLPEWDGTDCVSELAQRISDKPLWVNWFHRWMLAMAAQWMNLDGQCANALAPLLPMPDGEAFDLVGSGAYTFEIWKFL